jgi:hypothetical protein
MVFMYFGFEGNRKVFRVFLLKHFLNNQFLNYVIIFSFKAGV